MQTGEPVNFDASGSSDPDGTIAKYEWDLDGNGSYETNTGATATASQSYATPGNRTIGLRVTDDDGATATTTQHRERCRTEHPRCVASPPRPNRGHRRHHVAFNASASSDPDGTIAKYEWDLDGNGSYETNTGTTPTASHSYATPGERNVGLRVTDNNGATATRRRSHWSRSKTAPRPPPSRPRPTRALTGATVAFNASASSDPDGTIAKYEWDLDGNGSYETNTGATATTTTTLLAAGDRTIGLRVTDNSGGTRDHARR